MPPRHSSRSVESSSSPGSTRVARVLRGVDHWNAGEFEEALEDLDPAIEWRTSGVVPGLDEVYHGHDGVMRFWRSWTETWEIQIEVEDLREQGDDVLVFARFRARGRDGVEVDQPVAFTFTGSDVGLLTHFQAYWNRADVPVDINTSSADLD